MFSPGYDSTLRALDIEFPSRDVYRYHPVPPAKFHALLQAESKGQYFNAHIKDQYPFELLKS